MYRENNIGIAGPGPQLRKAEVAKDEASYMLGIRGQLILHFHFQRAPSEFFYQSHLSQKSQGQFERKPAPNPVT